MTEDKKHNIKVYSTKTCPYCIALKAYLDEKNIKHQYIDVGADQEAAKEMMEKSGQMGVPVVDVDGEILVGFDKKRIDQLLNIKD